MMDQLEKDFDDMSLDNKTEVKEKVESEKSNDERIVKSPIEIWGQYEPPPNEHTHPHNENPVFKRLDDS